MRKCTGRNSRFHSEIYRKLLLGKKAKLLSRLGVSRPVTNCSERLPDEDRVTVVHEEFIVLSLGSLICEHLRLVEEALDRLDSGEYGVCLACAEPIDRARLRALPWAKYCVACQEAG